MTSPIDRRDTSLSGDRQSDAIFKSLGLYRIVIGRSL